MFCVILEIFKQLYRKWRKNQEDKMFLRKIKYTYGIGQKTRFEKNKIIF